MADEELAHGARDTPSQSLLTNWKLSDELTVSIVSHRKEK